MNTIINAFLSDTEIINLFNVLRLAFFIYCYKHIRIPESFNTNISHQLFDYKITFVNSHRYINSKGNFVLKNRF